MHENGGPVAVQLCHKQLEYSSNSLSSVLQSTYYHGIFIFGCHLLCVCDPVQIGQTILAVTDAPTRYGNLSFSVNHAKSRPHATVSALYLRVDEYT